MRMAWVGLENNTYRHAAAAKFLGFIQSAVVAPAGVERSRFADLYNISRQYDTLDELLADGEIDAVCLDLPCPMQASHAIACLNAGVSVLVETPMAMDADEAREIWAAAQKTGTPLMVAHDWRFDDEVRSLKSRVSSGGMAHPIQRINGCQSRALVNAIDRARFVLGDPEPVSVYAYFDGSDPSHSGVVIVNWDNGAASVIEAHLHSALQAACLDSAYISQLAHFADCTARRVQPDVNGAHGYLGLCIVDAAYASARIGKVIAL